MKEYSIDDVKKAVRTWKEAARTLGITVCAPYTLRLRTKSFEYLAFLRDFGSPGGMVVAPLDSATLTSDRKYHELARQAGLFCSSVDPRGWAVYEERNLKDALEDWGYFGPLEKRPSWIRRL